MKIIGIARKLFQLLREEGFLHICLRVFHRSRLISVLHTFEIVHGELSNPVDRLFSRTNQMRSSQLKLQCREIKEYELDKLKFADGVYSLETFRMHFANGMRFFAAFHEDLIVAVNGIHEQCANLVYVKLPTIELPHGIVYLNCALTAPAYGNRSIGTVLRGFMLEQLKKEGFQSAVGAVFIENRHALRWNMRNGFTYWGRISYIRCGKRDFWWKHVTRVGRRYGHIFDHVGRGFSRELVPEAVS